MAGVAEAEQARVDRYGKFAGKVGAHLAVKFCELPIVSTDLADMLAESGSAPAVTKYLCDHAEVAAILSIMAPDQLRVAFSFLVSRMRDQS